MMPRREVRADTSRWFALVSAGALLGMGLGGFVDGILLHQLLQWHNMLSSVRPPLDLVSMKYNMLWDGAFHVLTWLATLAGIVRLWFAGCTPDEPGAGRCLIGGACVGFGLFNFIEGLIDHQLLGIHHVRPGPDQLVWDLAFLASGLVLCGAGAWVIRSAGGYGARTRG